MTIKSIELSHLYDELWRAEVDEQKARAEAIREKIKEIEEFMS